MLRWIFVPWTRSQEKIGRGGGGGVQIPEISYWWKKSQVEPAWIKAQTLRFDSELTGPRRNIPQHSAVNITVQTYFCLGTWREGTPLTLGMHDYGTENSLEGQFREGVRRPGEDQRMYVRVEPRDITPQNHLGRWTMGLQNNGSGQSGRLFSLCVNININMIWFCIHIKLVIWNIFVGPILKSMFSLCYIVMFTSMLWFVLSLKDILELWLKKNFKGKRERRNCLVGRLLFRLALPSWVTSGVLINVTQECDSVGPRQGCSATSPWPLP